MGTAEGWVSQPETARLDFHRGFFEDILDPLPRYLHFSWAAFCLKAVLLADVAAIGGVLSLDGTNKSHVNANAQALPGRSMVYNSAVAD